MNSLLTILILLIILIASVNYLWFAYGYYNEYKEAQIFCKEEIGTGFPTKIRGDWDCVDVAGVMHNIKELEGKND